MEMPPLLDTEFASRGRSHEYVVLLDSFHTAVHALALLTAPTERQVRLHIFVRESLKMWFSAEAIAHIVGDAQKYQYAVLPEPVSPHVRGASFLKEIRTRRSMISRLEKSEVALGSLLSIGRVRNSDVLIAGNSRFLAVADRFFRHKAVFRVPHGLSDELAPKTSSLLCTLKSRLRGWALGRRFWGLDVAVRNALFPTDLFSYSKPYSDLLRALNLFHRGKLGGRPEPRSTLLLVPKGASNAREIVQFVDGVVASMRRHSPERDKDGLLRLIVKYRPSSSISWHEVSSEIQHEWKRRDGVKGGASTIFTLSDPTVPAELIASDSHISEVIGGATTVLLNASRLENPPKIVLLNLEGLDRVFPSVEDFSAQQTVIRQTELTRALRQIGTQHRLAGKVTILTPRFPS